MKQYVSTNKSSDTKKEKDSKKKKKSEVTKKDFGLSESARVIME